MYTVSVKPCNMSWTLALVCYCGGTVTNDILNAYISVLGTVSSLFLVWTIMWYGCTCRMVCRITNWFALFFYTIVVLITKIICTVYTLPMDWICINFFTRLRIMTRLLRLFHRFVDQYIQVSLKIILFFTAETKSFFWLLILRPRWFLISIIFSPGRTL